MQRVGVDPPLSGTPSLITDSRIVQRTDRHPERARLGVRDSSTTEFEGRSYHLGDTLLWSALSPGSPTPVRRKRVGAGAGITDLKSDQSVDSVTAHSVPAPSEARLLEMSEVPRICITRGRNGAVGNTSLPSTPSPSPTPVIRPLPRSNERPRQNAPPENVLQTSYTEYRAF